MRSGPRDEATSPFSKHELEMVLETAQEMTWNRRIHVLHDDDGNYVPGLATFNDPTFVSRTVQLLLLTGAPITALPTWTSKDTLSRERGGLLFTWRTLRTGAAQSVRVPGGMAAWLAEYLDATKPKTQAAYFQMLDRLALEVKKKFEVDVPCPPSRFAHTHRSLKGDE